MKLFIYRWLRRFAFFIAITLFISALCLTVLRLFFTSVDDYKENLVDWVSAQYNINLSVDKISAGIDFSGLVLTLNNIKLADSDKLPIVLNTDHVFVHLNFWRSLKEQKLSFNRVSLKGVNLTIKDTFNNDHKSDKSLITISSLESLFLQQLSQFSVTDSVVHFKNNLNINRTIFINNLRWVNKGKVHQGVGQASLVNNVNQDSLAFVVDMFGELGDKDDPLTGELYAEADNLNVTDYIRDRANPNAEIIEAIFTGQFWADFSLTQLKSAQVTLKQSKLSWSQSNKTHNWLLNGGSLQITEKGQNWLLDSYDLDIENNHKKLKGLNVSGYGTLQKGFFDFKALNLKDLLPFYLLTSNLNKTQLNLIESLDVDAAIKQIAFSKDSRNQIQFGAQLKGLKNRPKGFIPGLSNADVDIQAKGQRGNIQLELADQKVYFDDQFSRPMPIKSANINLNWAMTDKGLKLFSQQSHLQTDDLDSISQFSLLFPNEKAKNQSPFLSLYTYASFNDLAKAQYYYPVQELGKETFDYLQPTLTKGKVKGAKILWYGALNNYPYLQHNGIFQAQVPLRDAHYDFFKQWQGLSNLDVDLHFKNQQLSMDVIKAKLGDVDLQTLTANIDKLSPDGILTVNASVKDDAQKITNYIKTSPLNDSVGAALDTFDVHNALSAKMQIVIPLNNIEKQPEVAGTIIFPDNNVDVKLSDDLVFPLKHVAGQLDFINSELAVRNIHATLFAQPIQFSAESVQKKLTYQINVDIDSVWNLKKVTQRFPQLTALKASGDLNWIGNIHFKHYFSGGNETRVTLSSATQGVTSKLPSPFNKNALQSWPTTVSILADDESSTVKFNIDNKLALVTQLDYSTESLDVPYYSVNIGTDKLGYIEKNKHVVKINLDRLNLTDWYDQWMAWTENSSTPTSPDSALPSFEADEILVNVKHGVLFQQPLTALKMALINDKTKWTGKFNANNLDASAEYRDGVPVRLDFDIKKLDFKSMDLSLLKNAESKGEDKESEDLQMRYPEVFVKCVYCVYQDINLSPLSLHIFPTMKQMTIDYFNVGGGDEVTNVSGLWDKKRTNIVVNSKATRENSIIRRLAFTSPIIYQEGTLNGAFNWQGEPWNFNLATLNGQFSSTAEDGAITEVSDKGARFLSLFSLNGIRRALNVEFDNIFSTGLNFDEFSLTGKITNGVMKNDDFYLDGSAGKITGAGLVDLAHYETNFKFSYSPAVTSSLPVLTAFAVNPLTGAAVLFLSKILEPVVETIVQVDFSVKGPLKDPVVKIVSKEKGKVKLQNSEVLDKINKLQAQENE